MHLAERQSSEWFDVVHFTQRNLNQDITYWPPANGGQTNDFGHATHTAPILIKGRWEDRTQSIRRPNGEEVTSSAEVLVDRDLELAGYIVQGDATSSPKPTAMAREIQDFRKTPDLRNLGYERRVYL